MHARSPGATKRTLMWGVYLILGCALMACGGGGAAPTDAGVDVGGAATMVACVPSAGYSLLPLDCDDSAAGVDPAAVERACFSPLLCQERRFFLTASLKPFLEQGQGVPHPNELRI